MSEREETGKLLITLIRSPIGYSKRHKQTVKALGLRRLNHSVTQNDNAALRGMLAKVGFLVKVEEL